MSGALRTIAGFAVGAVGFALGGPLGFAAANLAFGVLFPARQPKAGLSGQKLEVNASEFDGPIPVFWGVMGKVGANIINVAKDKDGKPAGVLVKKKKKKAGGKGGGGQTVEEEKYFLVAEYALGASGDGGPLFVDRIMMHDSDADDLLWDRDADLGEQNLTYTPEYVNGVLVAEHIEADAGRKIVLQLGTEAQQPLAFLEEFWGAGNVCPNRGVASVGFNRVKVDGQPTMEFTVRSGTTGRREIITTRLLSCGIPPARLKLTQIEGEVEGAAVMGREPARDFCEKLASRVMCGFAFNNARVEDYSKQNVHRWVLSDSDLAAREGGARESGGRGANEIHNKTPFELKGEEEFQSEVSASFYDLDHNYEENTAIAPRLSARHSNPQSYDLPESARLGEVLTWARAMLDEDYQADRTLEVALLPRHCRMVTGNLMQVPHRKSNGGLAALDYIITEQGVHPSGLLTFRGVPYQSGLYEQAGLISQSAFPLAQITPNGNFYFQIFDCAPLHDDHTARPGFYVIANWPDTVSSVEFSPAQSGNGFVVGYNSAEGGENRLPARGTFGEAEAALGDFTGDVMDDWDDSTLVVKLRGDDGLEDESDAAILGGYVNLLRIGDEIIQFAHAAFLDEIPDGAGGVWQRWEITRMKRARRGTTWAMATHAAGEEVTLLDTALLRVEIALWGLGQGNAYQFLYAENVVDAAYTCNGVSLKPFAPVEMDATESNGNWRISFVPRTRFMGWEINPAMPILTAPPDLNSYLIEILDDSNNVVTSIPAEGAGTIFAPFISQDQIAAFGSAQTTLHVRALRLSEVATPAAVGGRGYETTETFTASGGGGGGGAPSQIEIYQDIGQRQFRLDVAGASGSITVEWHGGQMQTQEIALGTEKQYKFNYGATSPHFAKITGDLNAITTFKVRDQDTVQVDGIAALTSVEDLDFRRSQLTSLSGLDALANITELTLFYNEFATAAIEGFIDDVHANSAALGANSALLRFAENPGSKNAATSRAAEIADLETAGCEVVI